MHLDHNLQVSNNEALYKSRLKKYLIILNDQYNMTTDSEIEVEHCLTLFTVNKFKYYEHVFTNYNKLGIR